MHITASPMSPRANISVKILHGLESHRGGRAARTLIPFLPSRAQLVKVISHGLTIKMKRPGSSERSLGGGGGELKLRFEQVSWGCGLSESAPWRKRPSPRIVQNQQRPPWGACVVKC